MYNLMGRLFKNFTKKLKVGLFVRAFSKLKLPWHIAIAIFNKQFTL
jgi:hypothetical protein